MRTAPGQAPPEDSPDSNNRVDPSPYYPVSGRRMVMISYARRLPNSSNPGGKRVCGALPRASNMTPLLVVAGAEGAPARGSAA
jgi:hypothetical protein